MEKRKIVFELCLLQNLYLGWRMICETLVVTTLFQSFGVIERLQQEKKNCFKKTKTHFHKLNFLIFQ